MEKQRMGEIALLWVKQRARQDMRISGFSDPSEIKKGIGDLSQKISVPKEELLEFVQEVGKEILGDASRKLGEIAFSKPKER